jgi:hypothetical protein
MTRGFGVRGSGFWFWFYGFWFYGFWFYGFWFYRFWFCGFWRINEQGGVDVWQTAAEAATTFDALARSEGWGAVRSTR